MKDSLDTIVMINPEAWKKAKISMPIGTIKLQVDVDEEYFDYILESPFAQREPLEMYREGFKCKWLDDYDMDIISNICAAYRIGEHKISVDEFCNLWNNMSKRQELGIRTFYPNEVSERISKMMRIGVDITYRHGSDYLHFSTSLCQCALITEDITETIDVLEMPPIYFVVNAKGGNENG